MPHNRTRLWVGLAIAAVTIPVAAQYLYRPQANDARAQGLLQAARWNASNGLSNTLNDRRRESPERRNYLAEVNAAIGKQGTVSADGSIYRYDNGADYPYDSGPADPAYPAADYRDVEDDFFDLNLLDDGRVATDDLPNPAAFAAPTQETSEDEPGDDEPVDEGQMVADEGLSDGAIYTTVVNNLSPDERQEFVRAFAAMTPDQRADMLDGFRQNLEGNGP